MTRREWMLLCAAKGAPSVGAQAPAPRRVRSLRVTVLTTMLADGRGIGEWGFAALVEADGRRILFDTGARPDTIVINSRELGVDLKGIPDVVLSHNHADHTTGLVTLRDELRGARIHAGKGIFYSRPRPGGGEGNFLLTNRGRLDGLGIVEHEKPVELAAGVWLTGPVVRRYTERNFSIGPAGRVVTPEGLVEDNVPEDSSLVFDTEKGLVVLSGCGHAGLANTLAYARETVRQAPVYAALGGWHLFQLDEERLQWTAGKMREYGVQHFLGAHCTGVEAVYRIRQLNGMPRERCVVGAVGAVFDLERGISPGMIAR
ncbi:MAG: MBL fold metallo-hydrolase [Bryobacteraceae bacterium]|nr:MBL fold metallo-hydrolase [Bryobacteraceae bacterium]